MPQSLFVLKNRLKMKFTDLDIYCHEILRSLVLLLSKEGRKKLNYIKKKSMIILIKILIQPLSHIFICSYIKYIPIHW